ncbi:MAG TPA: ATP-binding protein [Flavobacterium sp.]|nr:ATP-binding protein [Flavobacterium sp.]
MILKKFHFLTFVLFPLFFALQSCEKKTQNQPQKKSNLVEINRLIELGEIHFKNLKYDSSYYYFNKAKSLCDVKKDTAKIIYTILNLATIEQNLGDYAGSESTVLEALPFLKNNPKPNHHWGVYTTLGINYMQTSNYKTALYYQNIALNLKTDNIRKGKTKNNIAVNYMEMQNYPKAIQILKPLIIQKEVINDPDLFSRILDNLGYSYYKVENPKGIGYLKQSLAIQLQEKNDWGLITSYIHLSEYYKKTNTENAFNYALYAYEKSTKINNINDRLISLALLIQNSSGNELKKFSLDYIRINDSLTKARQKAKNQFAKIKYDSKKEKDENIRLKTQKATTFLELEQQKNKNLILSFLILIGILSTIFLYHFLKAINNKEKIQTSYDTETRIAKRLHDELANDVYHTMSFAETQDLSSNTNKEILLNNLDTIYSRTRNISKENSPIDTGMDFMVGLKEMISGFNTAAVNILIYDMDSFNWNELEINKKIIVYRVIQELLVNMKKHSHGSLVVITFKKIKNKLQIDYSDNGLGAAFDKINSRNGLRNVENRILAIKGTITFDTKPGKGFKTSLSIPL